MYGNESEEVWEAIRRLTEAHNAVARLLNDKIVALQAQTRELAREVEALRATVSEASPVVA